MAHWEERDPRWHVTELGKKGSNVNGWHWEEIGKLSWAESRLKDLFRKLDQPHSFDKGEVNITGLNTVTGEAYLTRRKGDKILAVYDLHLSIGWKGSLTDDEKEVTGLVNVAELSTGNDDTDYLITTTSHNTDEKYSILEKAIQKLKPEIVEILAQFDKEIMQLRE